MHKTFVSGSNFQKPENIKTADCYNLFHKTEKAPFHKTVADFFAAVFF